VIAYDVLLKAVIFFRSKEEEAGFWRITAVNCRGRMEKVGVHSMTGYGSASGRGSFYEFTVEVKGVNSRFLDLSIKLPGVYQYLEQTLRRKIVERIERGKVELFIGCREKEEVRSTLELNQQLLLQCFDQAERLLIMKGLGTVARRAELLMTLLGNREYWVSKSHGFSAEEDASCLDHVVEQALNNFVTMRLQEGSQLVIDLRGRVETVRQLAEEIHQKHAAGHTLRAEALKRRVAEIVQPHQVDESRWIQEVAYLAERSDIAEELVRLRSHIEQAQGLLTKTSFGKELTFLQQELLREVNTITSKSPESEVKYLALQIKSELEKVREQAQNLE
jgi:uncharacterized protein (TIGR00255 family)